MSSSRLEIARLAACLLAAGLLCPAAWAADTPSGQPASADPGLPVAETAPRCPTVPGDADWIELEIREREGGVAAQRDRAIGLLEDFLARHPAAPQRADALFRLAELQWEKAEALLLSSMRGYEQELEAFRSGKTKRRPPEPRIDLAASIRIYEEILDKHPDFSRTDVVLYLYGFALNEQGEEETALSIYRSLIKRFPRSHFAPDAFLAIGEYHFAKGHFDKARESYARVLEHPGSLLYDLAMYKTAWCYFKEGKPKEAASRFRKVLESSRKQSRGRKTDRRVAAASLEKEALEDLAFTFSEVGGAAEAYRFMEQVGGKGYSIKVLENLGQVFFNQARYDKAAESYQMLVDRFPLAADGPEHQNKIAIAYERMDKLEKSLAARTQLAERFGPGSSWAREHAKQPELIDNALRLSEEALRFVALARHKQAQERKRQRDYETAAAAYLRYLERFEKDEHAPRIHFHLGEVLFKLERFEKAADHYGRAVARAEDKALRHDAAYAAVLSWDRLRRKQPEVKQPPNEKQSLSDAEQGFIASVGVFAEIAPDDEKLPQLRFEIGRVHFERARYTEASETLLELVEQKPKDKYAEAAADLALDCFAKSEDWPSLERWARKFIDAGWFTDRPLGKELPGFVTAAIFQHGAQLDAKGEHAGAAEEYQRLVEEFPKNERASKALFNAAVSLEKAGEKSKAVEAYQRVIATYPDRAPDALFVIAGIYERQYDYRRAAQSYVQFADRFRDDARAPDALLQASMLRGAIRDFDDESRMLELFTQRYPKHDKAPEALFRSGLALMKAEKLKQAEKVFWRYQKNHAARLGHVREADLQLGKAVLAQRHARSARKQFEHCGAFSKRRPPEGSELAAAAECRFLLGELIYSEYEAVELAPPMRRLAALLNKKAAVLKKAEELFTRVVEVGHPEWASAALFRIGDMYAKFAQAIYKAPMPAGMDDKEKEVYRQELQTLAFPIEDKALSAFSISHEVALNKGYFSRWSVETIRMLRKLDPARFPKEDEVRPCTQWADSFTRFPLELKPLPVPSLPKPPAKAGEKKKKKKKKKRSERKRKGKR